jgi:ketosteroid isomerase-like protein
MDDARQIQHLINAYHEAGSVGDYERMIATFAPDAIWEFTRSGQQFVGHAAISDAVGAFTGSLEYVAQINAPAVIAIDGDVASARSSIRESGKFAGRDEGVEAFGIYHDTLVRDASGWKFTRRAFELRWMHRVPILPATITVQANGD